MTSASNGRIAAKLLNIFACLCAVIIIWQFAHRNRQAGDQPSANVQPGSDAHLEHVSWQDQPQTLVYALSTYSGYCRESAGFYRSLNMKLKLAGQRSLAVLRESPDIFKPSLRSLGIENVSEIRQAEFGALGVVATPTLLLIDQHGKVRHTWTGKLPQSQEREVFAALHLEYSPPLSVSESAKDVSAKPTQVPASELRLLLADPAFLLVDTRDRTAFAKVHVANSLNIPYDEVEARGPHEIPSDKPVVIYCNYSTACQAKYQDHGSMSFCDLSDLAMGWAGLHDVRHVDANFGELAAAGVPIQGTSCK